MMRKAKLAALLLVALAVTPPAPVRAAELGRGDMIAFLVQCIGTGKDRGPQLRVSAGSRCPTGPQRTGDRLDWRKHDWPGRGDARAAQLGYMASDAVLDGRFAVPVIAMTFDFGDTERRFGRLDRPNGDGGDAATILDGAAWIFFTEDGGGGQQWFVAEACRTESRPEARLESWFLFADDAVASEWRARVARLVITKSGSECPAKYVSAYTRYRRATIPVPFRIVDGTAPIGERNSAVDTIVSEHYGNDSTASADHLERFYLGRGLGKYRWERWENLSKSLNPKAREMAVAMRQTARCPALPYSDSPGPDWAMVDCRNWTNLVRQEAPFSVARFGWPGNIIDAVGRAGR